MTTNITKPYLLEQCQSFVLNKLANEPSNKDGINASFVINSDDYFFLDGSLEYLLDLMVKEGTISYNEEDGKYSIADFVEIPIFSLVNYTAYQLSANYGVQVCNSEEEAEGCALIKSGANYAILLKDEVIKPEVEPAPLKEEIKELRAEPLIRNESKKEKRQRAKAQKAEKKQEEISRIHEEITIQEETTQELVQEEPLPSNEPSVEVEEVFRKVEPVFVYDEKKAKAEQEAMSALGMFDEPESEPVVEEAEKSDADTSEETLKTQEKLATSVEVKDKSYAYNEFKAYIAKMDAYNKYDYESRLMDLLPNRPSEHVEEEPEQDHFISVSSYAELKNQMSKKGILVKPYVNQNAYSYYADNFYFVNRLSKDASIVTFALIFLEVLLGYLIFDKVVEKGLIFYLVVALVSLVIPVFFIQKYLFFRFKRKKTDYNFRISLTTAIMVYLNIMVIVVLLGFFIPSLNVTLDNVESMIVPIFYPAVLLSNIPIYVCIYGILYTTKRYHLH